MKVAEIPVNEEARITELNSYQLLDTLPESEFDDITKLASQICKTPIALISLIDADRQWFKSKHGLEVKETPRDIAFCSHAINEQNQIMTIPDSREDERFSDNPLVVGNPNVIFYAGVPLVTASGYALGTICIIDHKPRELNQEQLDGLRALSNQVIKLFEFRKKNIELKESLAEINARNKDLEQFAYVVSHDIKSPLNNIVSLTQILKSELEDKISLDEIQIINHLSNSSHRLKALIDGIISHYMNVNIQSYVKSTVNLELIFSELKDLLDSRNEFQITYKSDVKTIRTNEIAIKQILNNLIGNAIKYNDKKQVEIQIQIHVSSEFYEFTVTDNGMGIEPNQIDNIFNTFVTGGIKDRFNNEGTGIGLATVKRIVEKLGGKIRVESKPGKGSKFIFTLAK